MKKRKWTLGLLMCLVMTLAMIPGDAFAAEIVDSGKCGDNLTWTLDDEGTLRVEGTGAMYVMPWYKCCNDIKRAEISEGVTNISDSAFLGCSNLESVTIPDSVTSIDGHAFSGCDNLKNVTIPDGVTSIGDLAFNSCVNIKNMTIHDSVTSIGKYAFSSCRNLESVTLSANITSIGEHTFSDCTSLESVTIPDGVTNIGESAFSNCEKLQSMTIPDSVTDIGEYAFSGCKSLESVTLSANIKSIRQHTFKDCKSLKNVAIPDGVTSIDYMAFCNCENLKSVTMPDSVTSIGEYAFNGCKSLGSVTIPAKVTIINENTFNACSALESVTIPAGVTSIGNTAFSNCSALKSVTIPASVTNVGTMSFSGCSSLKSVTFLCDAPTIGGLAFNRVTATVYYPDIYDKWEDAAKNSYGGTLTWKAAHLVHTFSTEWTIDKEPTSTEPGSKSHHCTICDEKTDITEIPPIPDVTRLYGNSRYDTAIASAKRLLVLQDMKKFDNIVVACGSNFPDALTGSYLANVKKAPILLVDKSVESKIADYIKANLSENGTVYILGGTGAVSKSFAEKLDGLSVERLDGSDRYATNIAILKAANVSDEEIIICTGSGYADSLSASAVGEPILLVDKSLSVEQKSYLSTFKTGKAYVVGGKGVVSDSIVSEYEKVSGIKAVRVWGANRYTTSIEVAKKFFGTSCSVPTLAYAQNFPDGLSGGPVAMALNAPLILVDNNTYADAKAYCNGAGVKRVYVFGGKTLISDKVAKSMIAK